MTNEQAIDIIRNEYKCVDSECDIEKSCGKCPYMMPSKEPILQAYDMAIQALSQEPTVTSTDESMTMVYPTIVCDDAISRDAVLSIIDGWYEQNRETENIEDLIILITYMDSVTQKSGKWIKVKSGDKDFPESIVCSRCSNENSHLDFNENAEPIGKVFVTSKFCPNCGAKMESEG